MNTVKTTELNKWMNNMMCKLYRNKAIKKKIEYCVNVEDRMLEAKTVDKETSTHTHTQKC